MAEEKMILTQDGIDKLKAEYRRLIDVDRPDVIEALKAARAQGDLSENADYDAARDRQAKIESRITEIEHIMDIAVIVDESKVGKKIFLGNIVTYIDKSDNSTNVVKIVGTVEADPMAEPYPLISNESALGKALMGEIPGKVVTVQSEDPYEIEIVKAELSK
ncbi:MAG: Transcription elongation factor GreA [Tenericutes bacterium ADurb.BinA155]|jgi:transcription elongation factor GreA|nr:MAG: Transcription elongation factor GreA [Tenericutes bacterium ADurb.BinA155]